MPRLYYFVTALSFIIFVYPRHLFPFPNFSFSTFPFPVFFLFNSAGPYFSIPFAIAFIFGPAILTALIFGPTQKKTKEKFNGPKI